MKKVILLTVILIFALASVSWAVLPTYGPRINYMGYVEKYSDQGQTWLTADTLICVFNPNNVAVNNVGIAVFDHTGLKVADSQLINHVGPNLPLKGWGWQTLGNIVPVRPLGWAWKYSFVVYWTKPVTTYYRPLVIEIKEILFTMPVPLYEYNEWVWMPSYIRIWSEAGIGGHGAMAK